MKENDYDKAQFEDIIKLKEKNKDNKKPTKNLPTDRVSFDKQLETLIAFAIASGSNHELVTNAEVAQITRTTPSSVSVCNPFFSDIGLIIKEGNKFKPTNEVIEYSKSYEWDKENAAYKLSSIIENSWFAKAILPKLSLHSLSRKEAVVILAEASDASKTYEKRLDTLLEYLKICGLIEFDGNSIIKKEKSATTDEIKERNKIEKVNQNPVEQTRESSENHIKLKIPIPGKGDVLFSIPNDLDENDWEMFEAVLKIYLVKIKNTVFTEKLKSQIVDVLEKDDEIKDEKPTVAGFS